MNEIYWIQRLGEIRVLAWVVFVLAVVAVIFFAVGASVEREFIDSLSESKDMYRACMKGLRITPWVIGVSAMVGVFVPSTSQLYVIYGIGGTIDYIKSNDTAQRIPDKVINALDAWLGNQTENERED